MFTVEQLAGDLLPHATRDQVLATGFHRNHRINTEGGLIAEEWRVENVVDRLETTGAVWLGPDRGVCALPRPQIRSLSHREISIGCSRFFNNVPESGAGVEGKNTPPVLKTPLPEQEAKLASLGRDVTLAEQAVKRAEADLPAQLSAWEASGGAKSVSGVVWRTPSTPTCLATQKTTLTLQPDGSYLASGPPPATDVFTLTLPTGGKPVTGVKLEVFPVDGKVGRYPNGNFLLTDIKVNGVRPAKASADYSQQGKPRSRRARHRWSERAGEFSARPTGPTQPCSPSPERT